MSEIPGQFALDPDGRLGMPVESTPSPPVDIPGLRLVTDWLDADACRELLAEIDTAAWSTELRRRVQHYGHIYDYGRRSVARDLGAVGAPPLPSWAVACAERLVRERVMAPLPDQVIVNDYQPGQGISAHVDCVPCFGPVVASVSLGSACVMDFTHPDDGRSVPVRLLPGSLCVMTGPARYRWRHGIAARKSDPGPAGRVRRDRRVSVTFRTVLASDG